MFHVSYSVSINTGSPPSYTTGFTVASKVISEQNTFLPSNAPCPTFGIPYASIPASFIARCSDAVPADNPTAYLQPIFSHTNRSTSLIFAPTVDIQFVSYASFTYSISGPCMVGLDNQTFDSNFSNVFSSLNMSLSFSVIHFNL